MRPRRTSRRGGMTLVEVVIALAVLVISSFTGLSFYTLSRIQVNVQRDRRLALELCLSQMEQDRTVAFTSLPVLNGASTPVTIAGSLTGTMTTQVQDFQENGQTAYRMVTVEVTWPEDRQTQRVKLCTYRSPFR